MRIIDSIARVLAGVILLGSFLYVIGHVGWSLRGRMEEIRACPKCECNCVQVREGTIDRPGNVSCDYLIGSERQWKSP